MRSCTAVTKSVSGHEDRIYEIGLQFEIVRPHELSDFLRTYSDVPKTCHAGIARLGARPYRKPGASPW